MNDSVLLSKIRRRRRNFCSSRIAEVRFIEDYLSEGGCEHYKRELNNVLPRWMGEQKKKNSATEVFIVSANTRKGSNPVKRYVESTSNLRKKKGRGGGQEEPPRDGAKRSVPQRELNRWDISFHTVIQQDKEPQTTLFSVFPCKLLQQIKIK